MQKWYTNINVHFALAFKNGEEAGFDFFYRTLFVPLALFAYNKTNDKEEAEDIASNAFIKIWKRHHQFNTAVEIRQYLYKIVRNDCLKYHVKQTRQASLQNNLQYLASNQTVNGIDADMIRLEFFTELYKAANNLPAECRKVFNLLYVEGKTVKEAAEQLNLSTSTIKTQKQRSINVLRKTIILLMCIAFLAVISVSY